MLFHLAEDEAGCDVVSRSMRGGGGAGTSTVGDIATLTVSATLNSLWARRMFKRGYSFNRVLIEGHKTTLFPNDFRQFVSLSLCKHPLRLMPQCHVMQEVTAN